jgi:hypothetical protein
MSNSLDLLYEQFPVIRVNSWCDLDKDADSMRSILQGWKEEIVLRWGEEPFTPRVRHMLTAAYWAGVIRTRHQDAIAVGKGRRRARQ